MKALTTLIASCVLVCLTMASAMGGPVDVKVMDAQGRLLRDAVVYLESPAAQAVVRPLKGAEIAQRNKTFMPAVTVVTTGTPVNFPNQDTVRHHVYSFSPIKPFEIKLYVGTPAKPVVFDKPGVAVLGCNIHDTMQAWTVVVDTPWFAKTDDKGHASLAEVPAGRYKLRVWHATIPVGQPPHEQALDVPDKDRMSLQVRLPDRGRP